MKTLPVLLSTLLAAACGDNHTLPVQPDADEPDPDAPVSSFTPPTPFGLALSAQGPDQVQSATAVPGEPGVFFGAGFASQTVAGAKLVTLVKFSASGLDTTFGSGGVITTAVEFKGSNGELGIVTQTDGKILISATVANLTNAADRDVAVLRFNTDGSLDNTFGVAGVATINLNDAVSNSGTLTGFDGARGVAVTADGVYINAVSRGLGNKMAGGPRTDTDFTVARLTSLGVLDPNFATTGQYRLDIEVGGVPTETNATPRGIKALADGTVLIGGYATTPGLGTGPQPVIIKLTTTGAEDAAFNGGFFHDVVLPAQTEVYNFAVHGNFVVTGGYGREAQDPSINDYISLRFNATTGERDLTWGGTTNGAVVFDPSGAMAGSNCRNSIALPDGKTLMTGSTGPSNDPAQDAVFAILDADGVLDTSYGTGVHKFALGADGNDQFWGGAVSGDQIAVVGYKGGGMTQTETVNDDAYAAVFTVR